MKHGYFTDKFATVYFIFNSMPFKLDFAEEPIDW